MKITNEDEISLLSELPKTKQKTTLDHIALASKVGLGIAGLFAGILYLGPSKICAKSTSCGEWLTAITSEQVSIIVFTAGGLNYAGINAYMSAKCIETLFAYLKKQKSISSKLLKGSVIVLYTFSQNIQTVFALEVTSDALWEKIVTVSGAAPGALYGSVGIMEHELPYFLNKIKYLIINAKNKLVELFFPLNEREQYYRARLTHYRKLHKKFLIDIEEKWNYVLAHAKTIDLNSSENFLVYLSRQNRLATDQSWLKKFAQKIGLFSGLGFASLVSAPFLMNAFDSIEDYIPDYTLQLLTTVFLSSASLYGNIAIVAQGTGLLDTIIDLLQGKPILSLAYQLRPETTKMAFGVSTIMSVLSYAVLNTLFEIEFPQKTAVREGFRYATDLAIVLYHAAGIFGLYLLILENLTGKKREQLLFSCKNQVDAFNKMTFDEFIEFVESNPDNINQLFSLNNYNKQEESQLIAHQIAINAPSIQHAIQETPAKQSYFSSWCSWFSTKTKADILPARIETGLTNAPLIC